MEIVNFKQDKRQFIQFELVLSAPEFEEYLKKSSRMLQSARPTKGYRPGKMPLNTAMKIYGNELVNIAKDNAVSTSFNNLCIERDFAPVSQPVINIIRADINGLNALISFFDYPKIEKLDFRGLKPVKYERTCSEADIDKEINQYMLNHRLVLEVPREARYDDIVDMDFSGTSGGKPFPFDHGKNNRFTLGSGLLFAGLDEKLVGHVAGDDLELSLTMPENFHREEIAGLTIELSVHLNGVWERRLEECTDEYVKKNIAGCETVKDFREATRKKRQDKFNGKSKRLYSQAISQTLADAVDCYIPQPMIDVCLQRLMDNLEASAAVEGISSEEALRRVGKTIEGYRSECTPVAESQVKLSLALEYIARTENILISDDEISSAVNSFAKVNNLTYPSALEQLGGREGIIEDLASKKALEFVKSNITPNIVKVEKFPDEE